MNSVTQKSVNSGHELNGCLKLSCENENLEVQEGILIATEVAFP